MHRLGIQAFEPVLIEGKAIQLHPLVCTAFNADFDGDQMAVHVPLSLEAQLEARVLMMSTNNILSPANGKPIIVPSQDIVLGLYYISLLRDGEPGEGMVFARYRRNRAGAGKQNRSRCTPRSRRVITASMPKASRMTTRVETTAGRMLLSEILPRQQEPSVQHHQPRVDEEGRHQRHRHGLSPLRPEGDGDLRRPHDGPRLSAMPAAPVFRSARTIWLFRPPSTTLIKKAQDQVKEYEQQYQDGLITRGEKYNKVVDVWSTCTERVAEEMMKGISDVGHGQLNAVYMMAHSGARGSAAQIKQLAGMRGLMAKPSGEIIETPIISNFKEGLTVLEYFNSTHGARKGLADTALKTANSGYLTRRLVDVAQDAIITELDCGTEKRPHRQGGDRRRRSYRAACPNVSSAVRLWSTSSIRRRRKSSSPPAS